MPHLAEVQLTNVFPEIADIQACDLSRLPPQASPIVFLCALGFERRALALPAMLRSWPYRVSKAILFEYDTNRSDNEANRSPLLAEIAGFASETQTIASSSESFSQELEDAIGQFAPSGDRLHVVFDISCMANRLLMRTLKVLLQADIDLTILYAEADTYWPSETEYRQWQSRRHQEGGKAFEWGVGNVDFSRDFAGQQLEPLPDFVVVFPSFSSDRARTVVSAIDPSLLTQPTENLVWLIGNPHHQENAWRVDAMRELNGLGADDCVHRVSTFDFKEALNLLNSLYVDRAGTVKFTIAPMGSKLQAVAATLFCVLNPDVRVVFATPKEYDARQYSGNCCATWMIRLGSTSKLCEKLSTVGTLSIN